MTRFIFGGKDSDLVVTEDAGNDNALIVAASVTVALYDAPGGSLQDDYLLWGGSAYDDPATAITTDADGILPAFQGPDGLEALYLADGRIVLPRDAVSAGDVTAWSDVEAFGDFPTYFPETYALALPYTVHRVEGTSATARPSARTDLRFEWLTSDGLFPENALPRDVWLNAIEA